MYLQNIKFYEGWTESLPQIGFNIGAMRDLGIESQIQLLSFALSFATLTKCFADRISYLKHNQEPKLFSTIFLIDLLEVMIMFLLCYLGYSFPILTNTDKKPFWISLILVFIFGSSIIWFTLIRFTRFFSNILFHHFCALYCIVIFGLTYLFKFVSFIR